MAVIGTGRALRVAATAALVGAGAILAGCSVASSSADYDLVAGKQMFVEKCGSCHVLARADTRGTAGPNLDEAFQQSLKDGMGRNGVRGVVREQILHPRIGSAMPKGLVTGDDAVDVAAYVASVAAKGGEDTGLVAAAVKKAGGGEPAVEQDGTLEIDADPGGQLAYVTDQATAKPGSITVKSRNESSTPHDIVIEGKGEGEQVTDGATSEFTADFTAGTYTFYCSVPGHREAGMEGELVVK